MAVRRAVVAAVAVHSAMAVAEEVAKVQAGVREMPLEQVAAVVLGKRLERHQEVMGQMDILPFIIRGTYGDSRKINKQLLQDRL